MYTDRTGYCRILSPESKICILLADFHFTAPPSADLRRVYIIFSTARFKAVVHHLPYLEIVFNKKTKKPDIFLRHIPQNIPLIRPKIP